MYRAIIGIYLRRKIRKNGIFVQSYRKESILISKLIFIQFNILKVV